MMREEEEAERSSDLAMELDRQRAVAAYEVGSHTARHMPICFQQSRNPVAHVAHSREGG